MTRFALHCRTELIRLLTERGVIAEKEAALPVEALGYQPCADLKLRRPDNNRVVWVELEYRRADPIANPAKFLVAFDGKPDQGRSQVLVSAISNGVDLGRRQVCEEFVSYLNAAGIIAQAVSERLLRDVSMEQIQRLSTASQTELDDLLNNSDLGRSVAAGLEQLANRLVELLDRTSTLPPQT